MGILLGFEVEGDRLFECLATFAWEKGHHLGDKAWAREQLVAELIDHQYRWLADFILQNYDDWIAEMAKQGTYVDQVVILAFGLFSKEHAAVGAGVMTVVRWYIRLFMFSCSKEPSARPPLLYRFLGLNLAGCLCHPLGTFHGFDGLQGKNQADHSRSSTVS